MNRTSVSCFFATLLLLSTTLDAENRIELTDGTQIVGDVISASNGRYILRSTSLGEIEVDESSIRSIQVSERGNSSDTYSAELQSIQQQITNSPELMQMITALQSDPKLQEMLNDRQFMELVLSGDLETVKHDPRLRSLLANPSIQTIISKVNGQ